MSKRFDTGIMDQELVNEKEIIESTFLYLLKIKSAEKVLTERLDILMDLEKGLTVFNNSFLKAKELWTSVENKNLDSLIKYDIGKLYKEYEYKYAERIRRFSRSLRDVFYGRKKARLSFSVKQGLIFKKVNDYLISFSLDIYQYFEAKMDTDSNDRRYFLYCIDGLSYRNPDDVFKYLFSVKENKNHDYKDDILLLLNYALGEYDSKFLIKGKNGKYEPYVSNVNKIIKKVKAKDIRISFDFDDLVYYDIFSDKNVPIRDEKDAKIFNNYCQNIVSLLKKSNHIIKRVSEYNEFDIVYTGKNASGGRINYNDFMNSYEFLYFLNEAIGNNDRIIRNYFGNKKIDTINFNRFINLYSKDIFNSFNKSKLSFEKLFDKYINKDLNVSISSIRKTIELVKNELDKNSYSNAVKKVDVFPPMYSNQECVEHFMIYFFNKRADTIKELINLYEDEKYKERTLYHLGNLDRTVAEMRWDITAGFNNISNHLSRIENKLDKNNAIQERIINDIRYQTNEISKQKLILNKILSQNEIHYFGICKKLDDLDQDMKRVETAIDELEIDYNVYNYSYEYSSVSYTDNSHDNIYY